MNKDESKRYQKFGDAAKAVISGKYIASSALLKGKKTMISNQHFKFPPEKSEKELTNLKAKRIKEIIKYKSRKQ